MFASLPYWGQRTSDEAHRVQVRGHRTIYFLGPIAGPYLNYALPGHFILLLSLAAVSWHHRDKMERVE
jgi:hypothetical protein